jgi:ketosteroid isomerase-like protein
LDEDVHAIYTFHQREQQAVLGHDLETLVSLTTEDVVSIPPAGPINRGRPDLTTLPQPPSSGAVETLEYDITYEELRVIGNYAVGWGTFRQTARLPTGEIARYGGNLMRVLQRQPDGTWKSHRSMFGMDPSVK